MPILLISKEMAKCMHAIDYFDSSIGSYNMIKKCDINILGGLQNGHC